MVRADARDVIYLSVICGGHHLLSQAGWNRCNLIYSILSLLPRVGSSPHRASPGTAYAPVTVSRDTHPLSSGVGKWANRQGKACGESRSYLQYPEGTLWQCLLRLAHEDRRNQCFALSTIRNPSTIFICFGIIATT